MNLTKSAILTALLALLALTLSCGGHPAGFSIEVDAQGWTKVTDEVRTETEADTSGGGGGGMNMGNVERWRSVNLEYRGPDLNELLDSDVVIPRPRLQITGREYEDPQSQLDFMGIDLDEIRSRGNPLGDFRMYDLDNESRRQSIELETIEERTYGGNTGYYFEYTSTRNSVPFRQWGIVTISNGFLLKLLYAVPQEYYEERTQELDAIINSFEVN